MSRLSILKCFSSLLTLLLLWPGYTKAQSPLDTSSLIWNNKGLLSLVVSIEDSVVFAAGFNGHDLDEPCNNQSLTKNVMAILIGIAIDKGYIDSVGVPVGEFFPVLKKDPDPRKAKITLRDIMNQASGLWHENLAALGKYLRRKNPSAYVLQQPLEADPGSVLHYNNAASHLMSVILTKATGQSAIAFAKKYLFSPLGITRVSWPEMKDGFNDGCGLLSVRISTGDFNKIGQLMLSGGRYNGQQIVSEIWIRSLLNPVETYPAPWELENTRYGLTFYHTRVNNQVITYGMGWGGQFLILVPGLKAVISVNQVVNDRTAVHQSGFFMSQVLPLIMEQLPSMKRGNH